MIGEALPIALRERRRAGDEIAARPQALHQVPHRQPLLDIVLGVELPARVQRLRAARDHERGERDVRRHHQIAGPHLLHDPLVRHVPAVVHAEGPDEGRGRDAEGRVGHQRRHHLRALGGPEEDLLDDLRAGVGIHPDRHYVFSSLRRKTSISFPVWRSPVVRATSRPFA